MLLPNAVSPSAPATASVFARQAGAADLATLLKDSRARTVSLAQAYAAALGPAMAVPYAPDLNPPLWELGHIGWFQEVWIDRNPERILGTDADPACARRPSMLGAADSLYDSSRVAHATRWHLPLPDLEATLAYLNAGLAATLDCLEHCAESDAALYFYRLALFHEDMHAEAAVYMAQNLGLRLPPSLQTAGNPAATKPLNGPPAACTVDAGSWQLGTASDTTSGFAFDNELAAHPVAVPAFEIDDRVVSWRRYLELPPTESPRYLRQRPSAKGTAVWEQCRFGEWTVLDLDAPACHLGYFEVQAWCQRAGRVLPTEAQWETAAVSQPGFHWGQVWEWTASTFLAYPGFVAHPYRDYSAPWFGSRPVLRGASSATVPRMAHPRYRNYFTPERNDIYAGFRTCAPL